MCGCFSCAPYWGPGLQPRHVPDRELNWRPFGLKACAQSTEPHQPGLLLLFFNTGKVKYASQPMIELSKI